MLFVPTLTRKFALNVFILLAALWFAVKPILVALRDPANAGKRGPLFAQLGKVFLGALYVAASIAGIAYILYILMHKLSLSLGTTSLSTAQILLYLLIISFILSILLRIVSAVLRKMRHE